MLARHENLLREEERLLNENGKRLLALCCSLERFEMIAELCVTKPEAKQNFVGGSESHEQLVNTTDDLYWNVLSAAERHNIDMETLMYREQKALRIDMPDLPVPGETYEEFMATVAGWYAEFSEEQKKSVDGMCAHERAKLIALMCKRNGPAVAAGLLDGESAVYGDALTNAQNIVLDRKCSLLRFEYCAQAIRKSMYADYPPVELIG
eukprot:TRINITY_DN90715_c0_g1_i1.p1 TRINITY_DN90715_c0_g1~~TRINITY_DN90715_c0_g1_i1.p1  ORF type:complete len:208 (+),score=42.78 TRINITY_DN90715_c0_g1_i1:54-677(+)